MRRLKAFIFVILILASSITMISPVRSASDFTVFKVYWGTDQPVEVSPGDAATLTVILRYEAFFTITGVTANLTLPEGFKATGGGNKSTAYFTGTISTGSIVKLGFPIFISPEVAKGNYTADLELKYYIGRTQVLTVTFEVTGKPNIEVKALNRLHEGNQQIRIAVINQGDAAADNIKAVRVYASGTPVELIGSTLLGRLEPGENATISARVFVLPSLKNTILPLTVEVSCTGPRSVFYSFSKALQLPIRTFSLISPLKLNVDPKELIIGKSSKVYLELENSGNHVLSDVTLDLSPDAVLKIFGSITLHIDRLEPGEIKRVYTEMYVPPTTSAQTSSLTVTVTYFDEDLGIVQNDDQRLTMLLRGLIEISLTDVAVIPSTPHSGSPFSITVTVTNVGTSTAYAAYAIPLISGLPVRPFGPRSVYIGNIETNLPTTFTANLQLENTTERTTTLPVVLSYMDNLRALHNVTFNIPINVASPVVTPTSTRQSGLGLVPIATVLGVSAAAIIVIFVLVRRRMRRKV